MEGLQDQLEVLKGLESPVIRHGTVILVGEPPADFSNLAPCIYSACPITLDRIDIQLADDVRLVHFLFTDYPDEANERTVRHFKELLRTDPPLLDALPTGIAARGTLPILSDGLQDNFVRWMHLLYTLSSRSDQHVIKSELEFAYQAEELARFKSAVLVDGEASGMRPWSEFTPLPEFDVLKLLTLQCKKNEDFAYWRTKYKAAGQNFPAVIAASLTKPILYASINAVDLLLRGGSPLRKSVNTATSAKSGGVTSYSDLEQLVLARLIVQHGTLEDKRQVDAKYTRACNRMVACEMEEAKKPIVRRCTDLKQKAILADINTPRNVGGKYAQSDASKAIGRLFGRLGGNENKGMKTYKILCKADRIAEALESLQSDPKDPSRTWRSLSGLESDGLTDDGVIRPSRSRA